MKRLLIVLIVMVSVCSVKAQVMEENRGYFGLRGGFDISVPGSVNENGVGVALFNDGVGFTIGGVYNAPMSRHFYIEPGLMLYYNAYSVKKNFLEIFEDDIPLTSLSIRKFGFRIPVMLGYRFGLSDDVKMSIFTGPQLEVGLSGKEYVKSYNMEASGSVYGEDGEMHRTQMLWSVGVSINYQHFYAELSGAFGL